PREVEAARAARASEPDSGVVGPRRKPGAPEGAKVVDKLVIDRPGVYENLIVDGGFKAATLVRIRCDHVVLRNCTIRNGTRNGIEVYAKDVTLEGCLVHHMLAGTYKDQYDAHGITGCPTDLTIRDCEVHHVSGDSVQFDPSRNAWTNVTIEHCEFWTGPLEADAAGFKKGERPGENALDTKQSPKNPRSEIAVRRTYAHGFGNGQISLQAALNIKDHVHAVIEDCILAQNDICFRLRGVTKFGGATVQITHCACYASKLAVRAEDKVQDLRLNAMAYAPDVKRKLELVDGGAPGMQKGTELPAPPLAVALKTWALNK
ncbi:MAG: right-handed parallel beta-helix repeat-containing protein, partial [Planctomycetota bacterium]|nr:right-handed parallel beta-helix repeat-containing protein [Planctomycetota bacterium]